MAFLRSTRHLKQLSKADEAASDMLKASFPSLFDILSAEREKVPGRTFLTQARLLMDLTMMLMMRRAFALHQAAAEDGASIDLFL